MGRARRAERAEHLPAACCLLVVLEVAMVVVLMVKKNRTLCFITYY